MKKYAAVVFDWDGTVMDSTYSIVSAIQRASADLGLEPPSDEQAAWVIGLSLESALYRCVPDLRPDQVGRFVERYRHHYFGNHQRMKLFDGIVDVLEMLHQENVGLAVATGKSRRGLDKALHQTDTGRLFQVTRCADECASKPDPAMLHEILDFLGLEPAEVLMVGDTTHDMQMAANAGVDGMAVTYGAHDVRLLRESEPRVLVSSVPEMREWLAARLP